jgi:hypothetical protein
MSHLAFEFPAGLYWGVPIAAALLALLGYQNFRAGQPLVRSLTSLALRGAAIFLLLVLAARPVRIEEQQPSAPRRDVCLLVDRSASMSLDDDGARYAQAIDFVRDQFLPSAKQTDLHVQAHLFAEQASAAQGAELLAAKPDGQRTNLARGVLHAMASTPHAPAAVVALTDGVITDPSENSAALSVLLRSRVPFIAVGFGREVLRRSLTLLSLTARPIVPPDQPIRLSVELEATGTEPIAPFELLLLRDGQLVEKKSITRGAGAGHWQESFEVKESTDGLRNYTVQLLPPPTPGLHCPRTQVSTTVRIGKEKDLRVLFAQGSLTWDYKFIRLALEGDPLIKLAAVTQTTRQSILHQTIDDAETKSGGFPATLEELSKYRVLVLSDFRADQLSEARQEMIEKFCAELGGGVLVMGGPGTLDAAWNSGPLGRILPVRLSPAPFAEGNAAFRLRLAPAALSHPVFRITDSTSQEAAWASLPPFTHAAAIESVKPGAQVWCVHSSSQGPAGQPAVLMAQQRFGAGVSAVIGVQTFWRWRLGRDSDPQAFDRFWRQLLRYLAEAGREDVLVRVLDQQLTPGTEVRLMIERQPDATAKDVAQEYQVRISDPTKQTVSESRIQLVPGGQAPLAFRARDAGMYQISVRSGDQPIAFRGLEIRQGNVELDRPSRDMDTLRQWAALTGGMAVKAEECRDAGALLETIQSRAQSPEADEMAPRSTPVGLNWFVLVMLIGLVGTEWILRKQWDWN